MTIETSHDDNSVTVDWSCGTEHNRRSEITYTVRHDESGLAWIDGDAYQVSGDEIDSEVLEIVLRECEHLHNRPAIAAD